MAIIVKSINDNTISLPGWLMKNLNLNDGEEVKTVIEGKTLRLSSLNQFIALRGALSEDDEFDTAIEFLNNAWDSWKTQDSA
jgi:antitoxin component of MazEF toxin-antitoxin module